MTYVITPKHGAVCVLQIEQTRASDWRGAWRLPGVRPALLRVLGAGLARLRRTSACPQEAPWPPR